MLWLICYLVIGLIVSGCGSDEAYVYDSFPQSSPQNLAVAFTDPARGATGVPTNKQIAAAFTRSLDPASVTNSSFTVTGPQGLPVPGTGAFQGVTATFSPTSALAPNTTYSATLGSELRDLSGQTLGAPYQWTFTTGTGADSAAPTVTFTDPANGATGVALNKKLSVSFSEGMDPSSLNGQTFLVTGPGATPLAGAVTYAGFVATFTPSQPLTPGTQYFLALTSGARDLAGNPLASYTWSFTAGAAQDVTAPTVTFTNPASAAVTVPTNQKVAVAFNEGMDPLTLTPGTFSLTTAGGVPVPGTVTYIGLTATFAPLANLASGTLYTATVSPGARDLAGNALASPYTWTFTTGAAPDITPPTVSFTDPLNRANLVPVNQKLAATFSEAMDPLTLTTASFRLAGPNGATVQGTVTYVGLTATFNPAANLATGTTYTATVTTGARDLAGNALATDYNWSFTTGTAPDTLAPTVSSTNPRRDEQGVPINQKVAATFSEVMDPLTLTTATFGLTNPGGASVPGTVTYTGLVATFTPTATLIPGLTYTANITTAARDLAGNPLASTYVWSFTTASAGGGGGGGGTVDTTAPTVLSTVPTNTAAGVAINQQLSAAFSEGMDPATLNTLTFTVNNGELPVLGTVTYVGQTATFSPAVALVPNTAYVASITTGARDLAGNALATPYSWSFTTGAAPDLQAPTVTSTVPANGTTNVTLNQTVRATFSEPMRPATLTPVTFTLTGAAPVNGTVTYDAVNRTAIFTPNANLAPGQLHTATITTGAQDLAGNGLAANFTWTFTTGAGVAPIVTLGAIAPFGSFGGGAGITNQGILTVINGDIGTTGVNTVITGFHDTGLNSYMETPLNMGSVNGTIYTATAPPGSTTATDGGVAALNAYNQLAALPGGINLGTDQLGGLTLAPGVYTSAPGTYQITGSDLTLDARGNPDATWVFQMASSLTVGGPGAAFPRSVILTGGAQAKNVYWQVGTAATINAGGGGTMVGTIIARTGVVISTAGSLLVSTLNGRAIGLNAAVTMVNTVINVPAP